MSRSDSGEPIIRVNELEKHFPLSEGFISSIMNTVTGSEPGAVHAVDGVSFELNEGETLGLAGESGCGKTTTGMSLVKLHEPTGGSIEYRGVDLDDASSDQIGEFRRNAQMIFQDPFESLNPRMTVYDIVSEPLRVNDVGNQTARVERALDFAGLRPPEKFYDQYPNELSGGQRQRIAIARALVLDPDFIVADEPVSMLDVSLRAGVLSLLKRMTEEYGLSVVYISHDLSLLRHMCDRLAIMYMGKIVEKGPTNEVIENPQHPYTKALIDAVPVPDPSIGRERVELPGEVGDVVEVPSGCRFRGRCGRLIQPEQYDLPDDDWRKVVDYMRDVQRHDVRGESESEIRAAYFSGDRFGGEAGGIVDESISLVASGGVEEADEMLTESFEDASVCAKSIPPLEQKSNAEQAVACHLFDGAGGIESSAGTPQPTSPTSQ